MERCWITVIGITLITGGSALAQDAAIHDNEAARVPESNDMAGRMIGDLKDIQTSFKLDTRLTKSLYMGERWVSPPTYSGARQQGNAYIVEARAHGIDAMGRRFAISPDWIPSDPEMVSLSPAEDKTVKIRVQRAGESTLNVTAHGLSRELLIKATSTGSGMQVKISQ